MILVLRCFQPKQVQNLPKRRATKVLRRTALVTWITLVVVITDLIGVQSLDVAFNEHQLHALRHVWHP